LNASNHTEHIKGQALVELAVILPILILFLATILPLMAKGVALPWLDERLTLRQLVHPTEDHIHHVLELTHDLDVLPAYFQQSNLEESTRRVSLVMTPPPLGRYFPGDMTRKQSIAALTENEWWNRKILGDPQERKPRVSRDLTMLTANPFIESEIPDVVKRLTLAGAASGNMGILEKTGLNLFHLDLNALPQVGEGGEG